MTELLTSFNEPKLFKALRPLDETIVGFVTCDMGLWYALDAFANPWEFDVQVATPGNFAFHSDLGYLPDDELTWEKFYFTNQLHQHLPPHEKPADRGKGRMQKEHYELYLQERANA